MPRDPSALQLRLRIGGVVILVWGVFSQEVFCFCKFPYCDGIGIRETAEGVNRSCPAVGSIKNCNADLGDQLVQTFL